MFIIIKKGPPIKIMINGLMVDLGAPLRVTG